MAKIITETNSTMKIKAMADVRPIAVDDADSIVRSFHLTLSNDNKKNSAEA